MKPAQIVEIDMLVGTLGIALKHGARAAAVQFSHPDGQQQS
jgi:hypothetical protein